jgi:hypothetical protein
MYIAFQGQQIFMLPEDEQIKNKFAFSLARQKDIDSACSLIN